MISRKIKIDSPFDSVHCASFNKTGSKKRGGAYPQLGKLREGAYPQLEKLRGGGISLVGKTEGRGISLVEKTEGRGHILSWEN